MKILHYTNEKYPGLIGVAVMAILSCMVLIALVASPVHAAVFVYGPNYNYSEVVLPNASYVHQGENISQGFYYDLLGIYGFSGQIARWDNDDYMGYTTPDTIITIEQTPHHFTYIDPVEFPVGRYYQWDGEKCREGSDVCNLRLGHGNSYVFAVVKNVTPPVNASELNQTVVERVTIISFDANGSKAMEAEVIVPAQNNISQSIQKAENGSIVHTITLTPPPTTAAPGETQPEMTTIVPGVEIPEVTPRQPLPAIIAIISLLVIVWLRN